MAEQNEQRPAAGKRPVYGRLLAAAGLIAGLAMMAAGLAGGQAQQVWQKAAMVCLECIGIG